MTMSDKVNLRDVSGDEQEALLVSKRDRMVSIYRPSNNPIHKNGMELVATVTVSTDPENDPDGSISIGLGYSPETAVYVEYLDDDPPETPKAAPVVSGSGSGAAQQNHRGGGGKTGRTVFGTLRGVGLWLAITTRWVPRSPRNSTHTMLRQTA